MGNIKCNACSPQWLDETGDGDVWSRPTMGMLCDAMLLVHSDVKSNPRRLVLSDEKSSMIARLRENKMV